MNEKGVRSALTRLGIKPLENNKGWVNAECPFGPWKHAGGRDSDPDFYCSFHDCDASHYNCFGCGSKGSLPGLAFSLAKLRNDLTLMELGRKLQEEEIIGISEDDFGEWKESRAEITKHKVSRLTEFPDYSSFLAYPSVFGAPEALRYLAGRGIAFDTVTKIDLRFDPRRERILFPVFDYWTGRYVGCSGRIIWTERKRSETIRRLSELRGKRVNIPKIRDYHGLPKRNCFLGLRSMSRRGGAGARNQFGLGTEPVAGATSESYLVEGLFAFAHFVQRGFGDRTQAILGSDLTDEKIEILEDQQKALYWFVDPDAGGQKALYGPLNDDNVHSGNGVLDKMYGKCLQYIPDYPDDVDDPDKLTRAQITIMSERAPLYIR